MTEPTSTPLRVVTLVPAATELLFALGLDDLLVGVSHECDAPTSLPRLTHPRISAPGAGASKRSFREDPRALMRQALAPFEVDVDALIALAPDVIITEDLCSACAVCLDEAQATVSAELHRPVTLLSLCPTRLTDVWSDTVRVGEALGLGMTALALVNGFKSRLAAVAARLADLPARPSVLVLDWLDPAMIAGRWVPDIIEAAGARAIGVAPGAPGLVLDEADGLDLNPDIVLVAACGYDLTTATAEASALRHRWPNARWLIADGTRLFTHPTPRLVDAAERTAAALFPERFPDVASRVSPSFGTL